MCMIDDFLIHLSSWQFGKCKAKTQIKTNNLLNVLGGKQIVRINSDELQFTPI